MTAASSKPVPSAVPIPSGVKTGAGQLLRQLGLAIFLSLIVFGVIGASIYMANQQQRSTHGGSPARVSADRAWQREDWTAAAKYYDAMLADDPYNPIASFRKAYALHSLLYQALDQVASGTPPTGTHFRMAREALDAYDVTADHHSMQSIAYYNIGCIQARLGQTDDAIHAVERAVEAGMSLARIAREQDFDSLRGDPRFQRLLEPLAQHTQGNDVHVLRAR